MKEDIIYINDLADELMEEALLDGGVVPHARDLAELVALTYPEEVNSWLWERRMEVLTMHLRHHLAKVRSRLHTTRQAERIRNGEAIPYDLNRIWAKPVRVPGVGYKALGNLTGKDHDAIGHEHDKLQNTHARVRDMHFEMADRVGRKLTKSVYEPEQIIKLWEHAYNTELLERSTI